jgi:hypothetical protein
MPNVWSGKPCARCDGKKGKNQADDKYCYRCKKIVAAEHSNGAHARAIFERYGLTSEDYDALYEFQGGRCALCRIATGKSRRLTVDHDHKTGKVRGLLCRPCNNILGMARDAISFFRRCIAYLEVSPLERMRGKGQWPPEGMD